MTNNKNVGPSGGHLPGLDGLRVGAMALVLLGHAAGAGLLPRGLLWRIENAGTTVFLVLSGFLVTVLLLRERERCGRIDTGRFLARRAARLLPSYYAMVAFAALLGALGVVQVAWSDVWSSLLLVSDYGSHGWTLGHTWSLSAEWKFYLLWPVVLLLGGARAGLGLALLLAVLPVAARLAPALCQCGVTDGLAGLEVRGDAIAWGCLAALAHHAARGALPTRLLAGAAVALWAAAAALPPDPTRFATHLALMAAGTACLVLFVVNAPGVGPTRLLEAAVLRHANRFTYSVFLWQQFFLDRRHPLPLAVVLLGLPAVAVAAHYVIERPMQQRVLRLFERRRRARAAAHGVPGIASQA